MIFLNLLYIYQLENYSKKRFLVFVYSHLKWHSINKRGSLDWTLRSKLISFLSLLLFLALIVVTFLYVSPFWSPAAFLLGIIFFPFLILFADLLLAPLVGYQKKKITRLAARFLREQKEKGLLTMGITGSYGKTTMRDVLLSVLQQKYKVFIFPGNVNTDIGIAQHILLHKQEIASSEILLAEMGAYHIGEIADLCAIVQPDYSITTAIGEAHLERFGSHENIAQGKFELAQNTQKKAFLNGEDKGIQKYKEKFLENFEESQMAGAGVPEGTYSDSLPKQVGSATPAPALVLVFPEQEISSLQEKDDFSGINFMYQNASFSTKLIAKYIPGFAVLAFAVAKELDVSFEDMQRGIAELDFVPHRLQIVRNEALNRTIIDDSYNGNEAGFLEGLRILSRAKGRKIVLTPGIVELGKRAKEVHISLAKKYAKSLDFLLLVENSNTKVIQKELKKLDFTSFKIYKTAADAHADLTKVLQNGDTILFQNDTTDNYQ